MSCLFFTLNHNEGAVSETSVGKYSEEFKEQAVRRLMPPNAQSVAQVSRDLGVSDVTLYNWRNQYRDRGNAVPADPSNPENWSGKNKLAVVIETAALNEQELSAYCREKGLYVEQVRRWRAAAETGADVERPLTAAERREWQQERKKSRKLEKELNRKDKALAEAAALLVLQKKPKRSGGTARTIDRGSGSPTAPSVRIDVVGSSIGCT
jgi:transposase